LAMRASFEICGDLQGTRKVAPCPGSNRRPGTLGCAGLGFEAPAPAGPVVAMGARLLRQLSTSVIRTVRQILGARHPDVEDLTQESLTALLAAWPNFRGECSPAHYARRIAAQRCIDELRKHRVRSSVLAQLSSVPTDTADRVMPTTRLQQAWRSALADLPPEQALALTRRYVLGYTLEELAQEARVPLNTVKSRLRLGKHALRARVIHDPRLADVDGAPSIRCGARRASEGAGGLHQQAQPPKPSGAAVFITLLVASAVSGDPRNLYPRLP
jgi:RNA polymerase sigma-70 factor (ECF subfamily)